MDWTESTLAGVIAGFVLSLLGTWGLDTLRTRRQAAAVRTMIRLELARNVQALETFWNLIPPYVEPEKRGEDEEDFHFDIWTIRLRRAEAFVRSPLPRLSRVAWEGQVAAIPEALTGEEIERVDGFYGAIDAILAIRTTLTRAADADERKGGGLHGSANEPTVNEQIGKLWPRLEQTVATALEKGRQGLL
jgi:hypothetical protein